jgi:hypothetical protein
LRPLVDRAQRGAGGAIVLANLAFPALLFLAGMPEPWNAFFGEASPINWFSSVQCAILAVLGLAVFGMTRLGRAAGSDAASHAWPWLVLGLGFLFLSFDEQFQFHENARERVLKPNDWFTHVPGLLPGDVVLLAYVVAGFVLAVFLFAELKRYRRGLLLFGAALALIGLSAMQDSLALRIFNIPAVRHTQIIAEETTEVWAQALFGLSLLSVFFAKLRSFLDALAGGGVG